MVGRSIVRKNTKQEPKIWISFPTPLNQVRLMTVQSAQRGTSEADKPLGLLVSLIGNLQQSAARSEGVALSREIGRLRA